jgi:PhzF family phenazine biosynthesis protein
MPPVEVHRLAAFTTTPTGGNPAGVVVTEAPLPAERMQQIAAEVGYSETAFLVPSGPRRFDVRYFAPTSEVPFCGHATIASGVLLGQGPSGQGTYVFATASGDVAVDVTVDEQGGAVATLNSVEPSVRPPDGTLLTAVLDAFDLTDDDLDSHHPPAIAYAGAHHLVLVLADRTRLAQMTYDFDAVRDLMHEHDLTTIALLWRQDATTWHARNAFAIGGVVEDPATGAAAAAFGAYLRDGGHVRTPAAFDIVQGEDMGRRSELHVTIQRSGGIAVSGHAVTIEGP